MPKRKAHVVEINIQYAISKDNILAYTLLLKCDGKEVKGKKKKQTLLRYLIEIMKEQMP